jgi:hypothetical protein
MGTPHVTERWHEKRHGEENAANDNRTHAEQMTGVELGIERQCLSINDDQSRLCR